jgi:multicomponent Na+:H+ antiporter subunit A
MFYPVPILFLLAILAPSVHARAPRAAARLLALGPAGIVAAAAAIWPSVAAGETPSWARPWIPGLGIEWAFRLDGLGLLFTLLITLIGALVLVYAGAYAKGDPRLGRLLAQLLFFMGSMVGLVLVDDVVLLFVFWELTSVASYLLIGFDHEDAQARKAALQALLVTGAGGLALLVGLLLLGSVAGTHRISEMIATSSAIQSDPLYVAIVLLVLAGAFTKSAQVPFHFWLPNAMAAPTPVSAYLHSATMVKAGIYLIARLDPVLGGPVEWHRFLTLAGATTMMFGAVLALRQKDLKRILAYTTVAALGTLTLLFGIGTTLAVKAAAVFLLVHSLYKGALFLVAGILDHETGMRDADGLGGLRRLMPWTALVAGTAALSMAGLPPLFGFIAKELVYEAKLGAPEFPALVTAAGLLANVFFVAVAGVVGFRPFFGTLRPTPKAPHEAPAALLVGPAVLAGLGALLGMFPDLLAGSLVQSVVTAVRAEPAQLKLSAWHGFTVVLLLSVVTVTAGTALYFARRRVIRGTSFLEGARRAGAERAYNALVAGTLSFAAWQTSSLQNGKLRRYVLLSVGSIAATAAVGLALGGGAPVSLRPADLRLHEIAAGGVLILGVAVMLRTDSRLTAVAALGVVGLVVTLVFLLLGGPDLAMTQFAVETLSVLLFMLVLWRLPKFLSWTGAAVRARDALVSVAVGGLVAYLLLAATSVPVESALSSYFAESSLPLGKGRNVVNVILVDFRALDTLGEITVLALAALGVHGLMGLRPEQEGR